MQPFRLRAAGGRVTAFPLHPLAHCSPALHRCAQRRRQRAATARLPCPAVALSRCSSCSIPVCALHARRRFFFASLTSARQALAA